MSEHKKTNLVRLAVFLGIAVIAGLLYLFGVFDDNAHFLVINRADDEIFEVRLDVSYTGDVKRDLHASSQVSGKLKNFQNEHYPIPYGERVRMDPGHREDVIVGDRAQIQCYVMTDPIIDATTGVIGQRVVNTPTDVPLAKGKRTVLILTGNRESGYCLTFDGFVNWVFG